MRRALIIGLLALLLTPGPAAAQGLKVDVPTVEHSLEYLGFGPEDLDALRRGEILSRAFRETHDKQIAATFVMAVPWSMGEVARLLREGNPMKGDRNIVLYHLLGDRPPTLADFDSVGFAPTEMDEVNHLHGVEPGGVFNLAPAEIARFQRIRERFPGPRCNRDAACTQAVLEAYRIVLHERATDYWRSGIEGIAPYVRHDRETVSAGAELLAAGQDAVLVAKHLPEFHAAFMGFPGIRLEEVEDQLLWIKQITRNRPNFVLAHRQYILRPEFFLMAERQFYVGHTYNSLQVFLGCLPDGDRTIIFYTNRTSTDLVSGFASGLRRSIGRRRMMEEIQLDLRETLVVP